MKTEILYEDKHIMVVWKPAGLATQSAGVGEQDVVSELKKYLTTQEKTGQAVYLGVIHRLDQPVEGLLVFAKKRQAAADLTSQLQRGILKKQYYAVLCGKPSHGEAELVDYLYKDKNNFANVVTEAWEQYSQAKKAILQYKVLKEIIVPQELALANIHIETGRFHQIRAQMAHAGLPLLGDGKYGGQQTALLSRSLGVSHIALCAYRLEFLHPVSQKRSVYEMKPKSIAFSFFPNVFM